MLECIENNNNFITGVKLRKISRIRHKVYARRSEDKNERGKKSGTNDDEAIIARDRRIEALRTVHK